MRKLKKDEIFNISIGASIVVIFLYVYLGNRNINQNKVFVVAKVSKIVYGGESGKVYVFKYRFKNKEFKDSYNGNISLADSFFLLKISKENPWLCKYYDILLPYCFANENYVDSFWTDIPQCNKNDNK